MQQVTKKGFNNFKREVDNWIKEINSNNKYKSPYKIIDENIDNTQHNYELIKLLESELEDLKQELRLLKIAQIAILRKS